MELEAAKLIAGGLATVGIGLSAVGVGIVYTMASEDAKATGVLLTGAFGAVCLVLAFTLLFVF